MKIQVNKCKVTGKIFEEKDLAKYILHLKTVRAREKELRLRERIRNEFAVWLANERSTICDLEDIVPWFLKNQRYIMDAANALRFPDDKKPHHGFQPDDKFTDITLDVKFRPCVSNSHQCPDNGITNWCARDPGVTSYPGWEGHIRGKLIRLPKYDYSYPYREALNIVGLKTGSGGGGNQSWGYSVKIFHGDWIGLGQSLTVAKLKGLYV